MTIRNEKGQTLEEFLSAYDETKYRRPSNTVDMILMTVSDRRLKVLLIKRKDHPFIHDWAMPGGFINFDEDMETAVQRELAEETGYVSDNWRHLLTIPANATLASNNVHIYAAKDCRKVTTQHLDDSEFLNVVLLTEDELKEHIFGGDFKQAHHVLAWYLSKE